MASTPSSLVDERQSRRRSSSALRAWSAALTVGGFGLVVVEALEPTGLEDDGDDQMTLWSSVVAFGAHEVSGGRRGSPRKRVSVLRFKSR